MASANTAPPAGYPNGRAPKAEKEVKSSGNENKNVVENGEDAEKGINVYFMSGNGCGKRGSNGYGRPQQYQHQKYSSGYDSGAFGGAPPGRKPMGRADSNYSSHSQKMEGEYNSGHGIRPGHMGMGKNVVGYQGHNQGVEYGSSDEEEETVMVIKNEGHHGQGNGYGKAWKNQAGGGKHSQGGYRYQKAGGGGRHSEQGGYYEDEFGQACAAAPPPRRNNFYRREEEYMMSN